MSTGLTLAKLIGPIAAATIVNVFLFALAWRGHQTETRTGKEPWWLGAGAAAYGLAAAAFVYYCADYPAQNGLDLFGIAASAEAFGAVVVYGLLWGFVFTRGQTWRERAFPIGGSLFLAGIMIAAIFAA